MRVVFLDVDGVLNGFSSWPLNAGRRWIDPKCAARLNRITDVTDAVIVLTSTWRLVSGCDVPSILHEAGVKARVVGFTPNLPGKTRGAEILQWINEHKDITGFVILDDDEDMDYLTSKLVRTTWAKGLEEVHVHAAIKMLGVVHAG